MRRELTQDEYEYLKQFESNMISAVEANYSRNIRRFHRNRIRDIYRDVSCERNVDNIHCSGCLTSTLAKLKVFYDDYEGKYINVVDSLKTPKKTRKSNVKKHGESQRQQVHSKTEGEDGIGVDEVPSSRADEGLDS